MNPNIVPVLVLVPVVSIFVAIFVLLARYQRRNDTQLRAAQAACSTRLGWDVMANTQEPILVWNARWRGPRVSLAGTWKGQAAEFTLFQLEQVYQAPEASLALVRCSGAKSAFNGIAATGTAFEQIRENNVEATDLVRRFSFTGNPQELRTVFTPEVERALCEFPRRIQQIQVKGDLAGIVWKGWETDGAVLEQALDLAQALYRHVALS